MPLPQGFILDQSDNVVSSTPPQGFVLDQPIHTIQPPPKFVLDSEVSNTTAQAQGLLGRFGKQLYNIVPETEKGIYKTALRFSPGVMDVRIKAQQDILAGSLGPEEATKMQEYLDKGKKQTEYLKPIPVPEAKTWQEKGVDVAAGLAKFMVQLAMLRKGLPKGTPEGVIWEMQNLSSGGKPGHGAAMYALFGVPGKLIPGTSKLAKTGKLVAESALLGGTTAIEQKLTTGEIDWKDVAISAGIPPALHSLGYIKSRIKAGDAKVIEAVKKIEVKQPTQENINVYKTTDNSRKGILETDVIRKGERYVDKVTGKDVILDQEVSGSSLLQSTDATTETPSIDTTIKKINEYAGKAAEFRKTERVPAVKELRAKQAAGGKEQLEINKEKTAQERLRSIGKGMYGKAEKGEFDPPPLKDTEWNTISQKALAVYGDDVFKLKPLQDSLDKWRKTGKLPTDYELGLLEPIVGETTIEKLYELAQKQRRFSPWDIPSITISALKSPFGYDPQAARQLAPIMFRHPAIYAKAVWKNIRSYLSKDYASKLGKQLESDPMWRIAQEKAGINLLGTKPWKVSKKAQTRLQQYGDFTEWLNGRKNRTAKKWGQLLSASERGANLGIDYGMLELAKDSGRRLDRIQGSLIKQNKQPWTETQIEKYWTDAGKDINAFTKRVIATHPSARKIQNAANYVLFSPAYSASYPYRSWRVLKELFAGTPGNRTMASQYVLSQIGALTALSSIVAYASHKYRTNDPTKEPPIDSSINPMNSLWGHLRHGTNVYDFTFGEASYYRLLARVGVSAFMYAESMATGKQHTLLFGKTVPKSGEEIKRYITSRETVALGLGKALLTGKDWMGEPIDTQFVINSMMPMSALKDLVDAGYANGTWQAMAQGDINEGSKKLLSNIPATLTGVFGAGVTSYEVSPSTTRSNFRNIMAKKEHKKPWDDLTQIEQRKLTNKYRDSFAKLNVQVAENRIEHPFNPDRIKEEERKSGNIIRKKLNDDVQKIFGGTSLNISRSPQKMFLNDKRYNRYMELVAKYLNQRGPKLKLDKLRPDSRRLMLTAVVQYAKAKAYSDLRKEGI